MSDKYKPKFSVKTISGKYHDIGGAAEFHTLYNEVFYGDHQIRLKSSPKGQIVIYKQNVLFVAVSYKEE